MDMTNSKVIWNTVFAAFVIAITVLAALLLWGGAWLRPDLWFPPPPR